MEPRPVTLTLTVALALFLTAIFPIPSFPLSAASLLRNPSHISSPSTSTISPPPPPPPPPPPSPPPPPPPPLPPPPPSPSPSPHPPVAPPPRTSLSARPNDAQDPTGRLRSGRPPGRCSHGAPPGCSPRWPQHRGSGRQPREPRGAAARGARGLNLGEKVGFSFLVAAAVLQLAFGGFLIYARWRMGNVGYERDWASSSPSASSSAN